MRGLSAFAWAGPSLCLRLVFLMAGTQRMRGWKTAILIVAGVCIGLALITPGWRRQSEPGTSSSNPQDAVAGRSLATPTSGAFEGATVFSDLPNVPNRSTDSPSTPEASAKSAVEGEEPLASSGSPRAQEIASRAFTIEKDGRRVGHLDLTLAFFAANEVGKTTFDSWWYPDPEATKGYHEYTRIEYMEKKDRPAAIYVSGYRGNEYMNVQLNIGTGRGTLERNLYGELQETPHNIPVPADLELVLALFQKILALREQSGAQFGWKEFVWSGKTPLFEDLNYRIEGEETLKMGTLNLRVVRVRIESQSAPGAERMLWLDTQGEGLPVRWTTPDGLEFMMCDEATAKDASKELPWSEFQQALTTTSQASE